MSRKTLLPILLFTLAANGYAATYKWVDAEGRVNYSDTPPSGAVKPLDSAAASPAPAGDAQLPYPLRAAAARYPVKLYTSRDCGVCDSARAHLAQRGIPFAEQLLRTEADVEAFKRLGFSERSVPALAVGREKTGGFDPQGWDLLLDAAGYPKTSMLPRGWQARTGNLSASTQAAGASTAASAGTQSSASAAALQSAGTAATTGVPASAGAEASGVPERDFASPLSVKRTQAPTAQPARLATPASSLRF